MDQDQDLGAKDQNKDFTLKDQDKDQDLSTMTRTRTMTWVNVVKSVWTFQAFKLMQKTWEKYNEMEVNLKCGEMGTYHRRLRPMSSK